MKKEPASASFGQMKSALSPKNNSSGKEEK